MTAFFLLIPFLLIRFLLLFLVNKEAVGRAAYFAPLVGKEQLAYYVYQISNLALLLYSFFINCRFDVAYLSYCGLSLYVLGLVLCACSIVSFAYPDDRGFNTKGLYRWSRHPIYVSYFVCFLGISLLTHSWLFFLFLLMFQLSAHWIILSEERWCLEKFGKSYQDYMKQVRRYI